MSRDERGLTDEEIRDSLEQIISDLTDQNRELELKLTTARTMAMIEATAALRDLSEGYRRASRIHPLSMHGLLSKAEAIDAAIKGIELMASGG